MADILRQSRASSVDRDYVTLNTSNGEHRVELMKINFENGRESLVLFSIANLARAFDYQNYRRISNKMSDAHKICLQDIISLTATTPTLVPDAAYSTRVGGRIVPQFDKEQPQQLYTDFEGVIDMTIHSQLPEAQRVRKVLSKFIVQVMRGDLTVIKTQGKCLPTATRAEHDAEVNRLRSSLEATRETVARLEKEKEELERDVVRDRQNLSQLGEALMATTKNLETNTSALNEAKQEVKRTLELLSNVRERNEDVNCELRKKRKELNELDEQARDYKKQVRDYSKAIDLMSNLYSNPRNMCPLDGNIAIEKETCVFMVALGKGIVNGELAQFFMISRRQRGGLAKVSRDMFRKDNSNEFGEESLRWFNHTYGVLNVLNKWCDPNVIQIERFHLPLGYAPLDFTRPEKDHLLNSATDRFLLLNSSNAVNFINMLVTRANMNSHNHDDDFSAGKKYRGETAERFTRAKSTVDDLDSEEEDDGLVDLSGIHEETDEYEYECGREDECESEDDDDDVTDDETDLVATDDSTQENDKAAFTRKYVRRVLRRKPRLALALTLRRLTYESPASVRIAPSGALLRRAPVMRTASTIYYSTNTDATARQVLLATKELFDSVVKATQRNEKKRTRDQLVQLLNELNVDADFVLQTQRND